MNTQELDMLLTRDPHTRRTFRGVYARDLLPKTKITTFPAAFVANTDPSHKQGQHWVAFYFDVDGRGEYFDSYGLPPWHVAFSNFLQRNASQDWTWNPHRLQHSGTRSCGYYCLLYVALRSRGCSLRDMIDLFGSNTLENDLLVLELIERMYQ